MDGEKDIERLVAWFLGIYRVLSDLYGWYRRAEIHCFSIRDPRIHQAISCPILATPGLNHQL